MPVVANPKIKGDLSFLKSLAWNLSKKIHSNPKTSNIANKINDVLTLPTDKDNSLENYVESFIENGQISQQDYDNYVNNLFTGDLDYKRNLEMFNQQMAFNSAEAEKNRQWQTEMSNTAYQRQAEDLKAAGFNPALMLGGSGASVMSVNTPTASGSYSGINSNLVSLANSALSSNTNLSKGILSLISSIITKKK